jgi:hypothetical protein
VIAIDPEIEVWLWIDSYHVAGVLEFDGFTALRSWLEERSLWTQGATKPDDPKRAFELALEETRKPRSSALYGLIAGRVSVRSCRDPSFERLRKTMWRWFPG